MTPTLNSFPMPVTTFAERGWEGRETERGRKGEMDTCYLQQVDCHL